MSDSLNEQDVQDLLDLLNQPETDEQGRMVKESARLATLDGVAIFVYPNEGRHNARHLHARLNDDESASINIDTLEVYGSTLNKKRLKRVIGWMSELERKKKLLAAYDVAQTGKKPNKVAAGSMRQSQSGGGGNLSFAEFENVARYFIATESDPFLNSVRSQMIQTLVTMGSDAERAKTLTDRVCQRVSDALDEVAKEPVGLMASVREMKSKLGL